MMFPSDLKPQDIELIKKIFTNISNATEETKKSKVAFAEGYALGLQAKVKSRKGWARLINWLAIALLIFSVYYPCMYNRLYYF